MKNSKTELLYPNIEMSGQKKQQQILPFPD